VLAEPLPSVKPVPAARLNEPSTDHARRLGRHHDMLTMDPDARRQVVRILAEIEAAEQR
jgi:hypothetical protein